MLLQERKVDRERERDDKVSGFNGNVGFKRFSLKTIQCGVVNEVSVKESSRETLYFFKELTIESDLMTFTTYKSETSDFLSLRIENSSSSFLFWFFSGLERNICFASVEGLMKLMQIS